jgi:hypothetical protein
MEKGKKDLAGPAPLLLARSLVSLTRARACSLPVARARFVGRTTVDLSLLSVSSPPATAATETRASRANPAGLTYPSPNYPLVTIKQGTGSRASPSLIVYQPPSPSAAERVKDRRCH